MTAKYKVMIMRCDDYDATKIEGIIKEGMQKLDVKPAGKVLLKPNAVIAHRDLFPHAFTRKEVLDGVLGATRAMADDMTELAVGERSGITIPTRYCFKQAGYPKIIRKHRARTHYFVPKPIADADFLINLPKFKAHP